MNGHRIGDFDVSIKIEHDITPDEHESIIQLKSQCFPNEDWTRSYFKQLPHWRYLLHDANDLVAHMGIDHRVISIDGKALNVFGVADLCVAEQHRNKGIATSLLDHLTQVTNDKAIDYIVAIAQIHSLYKRNGFCLHENYCTWIRIDDHRNYGIGFELFVDKLLIKKIGDKAWGTGLVDFLGYLF